MKRARLEPILAAAIITALAWVAVLSPAPAAVRTPAAVVLLGVLPGYALLQALALDRSTGVVEKALLAVGTSLSLVVVLSVGIGLSVAQLHGDVVATVLTGLILGLLIRRWHVDSRTPTEDASLQDAGARWVAPDLRIGRSLMPWVVGAALAMGALAIAVVSSQSTRSDVVQLWATRGPGGATVGIHNDAPTATTYRLTIGPPGTDVESLNVTVAAGQKWQAHVAFPASWPPEANIVATLWAAGGTSPFRVVRLAPQPSSSP